jgi:hypothetical protein
VVRSPLASTLGSVHIWSFSHLLSFLKIKKPAFLAGLRFYKLISKFLSFYPLGHHLKPALYQPVVVMPKFFKR